MYPATTDILNFLCPRLILPIFPAVYPSSYVVWELHKYPFSCPNRKLANYFPSPLLQSVTTACQFHLQNSPTYSSPPSPTLIQAAPQPPLLGHCKSFLTGLHGSQSNCSKIQIRSDRGVTLKWFPIVLRAKLKFSKVAARPFFIRLCPSQPHVSRGCSPLPPPTQVRRNRSSCSSNSWPL